MNWQRFSAQTVDAGMCAMMYAIQRRHRLPAGSVDALERYITSHTNSTRDAYYAASPLKLSPLNGNAVSELSWESPIATRYPKNDRTQVIHFASAAGSGAPTVIFLHALMSASDRGYRQWAARFNAAGWNACFVHLPYHYSRVPPRHWNGELAITADLVRTAEGLRQGVTELRQLMNWLRGQGGQEFGLWSCSYGGWIGALLASVERDFRFVTLLEPIVDVNHAIWQSPAGLALRRELRVHGIPADLIEQHFHLTSPHHASPLCGGDRVLFAAGEFDSIARTEDIHRMHQEWTGSSFLTEPQGHFGYRLMPAAWRWLERRGVI